MLVRLPVILAVENEVIPALVPILTTMLEMPLLVTLLRITVLLLSAFIPSFMLLLGVSGLGFPLPPVFLPVLGLMPPLGLVLARRPALVLGLMPVRGMLGLLPLGRRLRSGFGLGRGEPKPRWLDRDGLSVGPNEP